MKTSRLALATSSALACWLLSACGGGSAGPASSGARATAVGGASNSAAAGGAAAPLSAETRSSATGDIPDNQVFLTFHDRPAGYSIRFPEGWARRGSANDVTFQDKNNVIHVLVTRGPAQTTASVTAELAHERAGQPSLSFGPATTVTIQGASAVKVSYATLGQPNPVTGKRVRLLVDRYVFSHPGTSATLDLGTPAGVDNVDAYRLISQSFRWR
jgi:hypothetical protein